MQRVESCPSCGGGVNAEYCPSCGERRASARVYTLRAFAHEAFETVTNVERSFLRTFWTLLRRPGELTAAYIRGERVRFLKPLQLLLLVNVAFFVFSGVLGVRVFTTTIGSHLNAPYRELARDVYAERQPASGLAEAPYRAAFNQKVEVLSRTLLIAMTPAIALIFALLYIRRRRPVVMHVVFATHLLTAILVITMVLAAIMLSMDAVLWYVASRMREQTQEFVGSFSMLALVVTYLYLAIRRAYGDPVWRALLKTALATFLLAYLLVLYRLLLFLATAYLL